MNKLTLLAAALIAAAAIACSSRTQRTPTQQPPELEAIAARFEAAAARFEAAADSLAKARTAARTTTQTAQITDVPKSRTSPTAAEPATTSSTAQVCPQTYTPQRGAQAGQPQPVKQGSRGGCYYLNASGNRTYIKP